MNPINFALRRPKTVMLLLLAIVMAGISVIRPPTVDHWLRERGVEPRVLEVDAAGNIVVDMRLQPETDNAHMQTRMAHKLANGTYLAPHLLAFKVKEYTPDGNSTATPTV